MVAGFAISVSAPEMVIDYGQMDARCDGGALTNSKHPVPILETLQNVKHQRLAGTTVKAF